MSDREESASEIFERLIAAPIEPARRLLRVEKTDTIDNHRVKLIFNDGATIEHIFHKGGIHEVLFEGGETDA